MENDQRPYQAVRVDLIGIERGLDRFNKNDENEPRRSLRWRNNLTALSQRENLFFIASDDRIAVYQPKFPYQTLKEQLVFVIQPDLKNIHAHGFLSTHHGDIPSHGINQLMVGDLGSQEILLLATDSGNITAYHTVDIVKAIRRAQAQPSPPPIPEILCLRPFFRHWVRQSAWGLDIHKEARMIAVSANTPSWAQPAMNEDPSATITVFAFALLNGCQREDSEENSNDDLQDDEWETWKAHPSSLEPRRDHNYKVVLAGMNGHAQNIPNISFINTTEDSEGTWLLSTDITGTMKLWRTWKGTCFRSWYFDDHEQHVGALFQRNYPGWSVAALDVNSFRPMRTETEFIGATRAPQYHGFHDRGPSFNLTNVVRRQLPGYSSNHPTSSALIDDSDDDNSEEDQIFNNHSDEEEDASSSLVEDIRSLAPIRVPDFDINFDFDDEQSRPRNTVQNVEAFGEVEFSLEEDVSDDESEEENEEEDDDDTMSLDEPESLTLTNPRLRHIIRRKVTPITSDVKVPAVAMIHCGDSHIRMLSGPRARFPHIFCANILRQRFSDEIFHTNAQAVEFVHMDRLNMLHKVPELGIVLVATQTGRVAVLALTRRNDGILGFRVDWVLPTRKQEKRALRPTLCPLVGIAVGPIQGQWASDCLPNNVVNESRLQDGMMDGIWTSFDPEMKVLRPSPTPSERRAWKHGDGPDPKTELRPWQRPPVDVPSWQAIDNSRRYRIMLTYSDMSVLTYEMSRDVEKSDKLNPVAYVG